MEGGSAHNSVPPLLPTFISPGTRVQLLREAPLTSRTAPSSRHPTAAPLPLPDPVVLLQPAHQWAVIYLFTRLTPPLDY